MKRYQSDEETRIKALSDFLKIKEDRIKVSEYDENLLLVDDSEDRFYVAVDDEDADKLARENIEDSLWAFNSDFIAEHSSSMREAGERGVRALQKMQEDLCEDANSIVKALIDDMDDFVEDAISADGRGHFISSYDGEEYEQGDSYIYCIDDKDSIEPDFDKEDDIERE